MVFAVPGFSESLDAPARDEYQIFLVPPPRHDITGISPCWGALGAQKSTKGCSLSGVAHAAHGIPAEPPTIHGRLGASWFFKGLPSAQDLETSRRVNHGNKLVLPHSCTGPVPTIVGHRNRPRDEARKQKLRRKLLPPDSCPDLRLPVGPACQQGWVFGHAKHPTRLGGRALAMANTLDLTSRGRVMTR